jgi:hypothetical protein
VVRNNNVMRKTGQRGRLRRVMRNNNVMRKTGQRGRLLRVVRKAAQGGEELKISGILILIRTTTSTYD